MEAARKRCTVDNGTLQRGIGEKAELEAKVESAEADLRIAKAACQRSQDQLEALKAQMTATITEITYIHKECSELRMMSSKNLKELSTFVERGGAALKSYRENHDDAKNEAIVSATERQKIQQKEAFNASNMSLLNGQSIRDMSLLNTQ